MDQIRFKKIKLAAAIALVTSTTLLTGCIVGDDARTTTTAETGNNAQLVNTPKGNVMGTVVDTNGNPIKGAKVYAGKFSATTGAGGNYQLSNVPVTNLTVTDKGDYIGGEIFVSIVPPKGYLGAIVKVEPTALIDNGRSDQGTSEETSTSSTNYFVDGFTAVAGHAVLPAIGENGATVTGVLRNDDTHEALANQAINLELMDVNGSSINGDGDAVSYTSVSYPTTTDENGAFSIAGVPNDSDLNFIIGGHIVEGVDENNFGSEGVVTDDEVEVIHVGNVYVSVIANEDQHSPYVSAIEEVALNATRAKLHDDTSNVLTVHFSEKLLADKVDSNSVVVRDLDANAYVNVTVAVAEDARSMTLTADANFNEAARLDIYLLKVDFQDVANNQLDEDDNVANNFISYDFDNVNGNDDYVKLQVQVYREQNTDAAIVTNFTQTQSDDSPQRLMAGLDIASSVFADVDMALTPNGIQQLNSADNDDGANGADSKQRIAELVVALDQAGLVDASSIIMLNEDGTPDVSNLGLNSNIDVDVARVTFTPSNATSYRYWVERNGAAVNSNIEIDEDSSEFAKTTNTTSNFSTQANNQGFGTIETQVGEDFADFKANNIAFTIDGVEPGDVIYVQAMDDFGNEGSLTSLTLQDNVAVTTGLQAAYDEDDLTSTSTIFAMQYGNGGELANPDAQALIGLPLLNITTGLLVDQENIVDFSPSIESLYDSNVFDTENDTYFIDPANEIYDATAMSVWQPTLARTIAVSFTEDLAWVSPSSDDSKPAASQSPVSSATTALTDWTIMNDITIANDGDMVNVDIASVQAANIFTLANTDGQTASVIDFTNVIQDQAGNVATAAANAKVVINDALPPMVTKAVYSGDALTVTFNEPVKVSEDDAQTVVTLAGVNIKLDADTIAAHNAQTAANRATLTIPFTTDNATNLLPINRNGLFNLAAYSEASVSLVAVEATDIGGHAWLDFSNVQDDFGNTWSDDETTFDTPIFAAFDGLGLMTASASTSTLTTASNTQTITYSFSHAIDLDAILGAAQEVGAVVLDDADVASIMTLAGSVTFDATTNATVSADRKTFTLNLVTSATPVAADSIDFTASVPSLWDTVDSVDVDAVVAP